MRLFALRLVLLLIGGWLTVAANSGFAAAKGKRVALVIGNSAYQHTPKLANPRNDASDMAAVLRQHGFQIVEGFDLDKAQFDRKVRDFATALEGATAGVFFYAGHGLQVAGANYLVPVDAQLTTAAALEFEMVRADVVHRVMERLTNTNVLFLDACRDNPLTRNLARAMGTRSTEIGHGLAAIESGVGTLISFSTQPGNVALDGAGRNSPFAKALVKHLGSSAGDLSAILIAVRNDVMNETQRKQVPWEHSALTGQFYFDASAQTGSPPAAAPARLTEAAEAWDRAKDATSIAVLEAFNARYKDTFYADLARARIEELKKQQLAVARPVLGEQSAPRVGKAFDGPWRYTQVGEAVNCKINMPDGAFLVEGVTIQVWGKTVELKPDGTFSVARPNPNFPGQTMTIAGTLKDGAGTFTSGLCYRKLKLTRN